MALPTTLARYRSAVVYLKQEAIAGQLADISTIQNTDSFLLTTPPAITQAGNYADTNEIGSDLISGSKILNYFEYSTFDFEYYAKPHVTINPSGGSVDETGSDENILLQNFFGGINTAVNNQVSYFFKNSIGTMSIFSMQQTDLSRQLFGVSGVIPTSLSMSLAKDGPVTWSMGMTGSRVYYGGLGETDGSNPANIQAGTGVVDVKILGPKRYASATAVVAGDVYFPGEYVEIVASDGTVIASNIEVASITDDVLTLTDSGSLATDVAGLTGEGYVLPFLITPQVSTTAQVSQRDVQVYLAAQDAPNASSANTDLFHEDNKLNVLNISVEMDRGITTPALTEMSGSAYPPAIYVINQPSVTGSFTALLLPKHFRLPNAIADQPKWSLGVKINNPDADNEIRFYMPGVHLEVPTISEAEGVSQLDLSFTLIKGNKTTDSEKFELSYR